MRTKESLWIPEFALLMLALAMLACSIGQARATSANQPTPTQTQKASTSSDSLSVITSTLAANPDTTHVITSADSNITVAFPPGALKETLIVSYVPYRPTVDQGPGALARFSITATTLDGQPVAKPDQPMILTLDAKRFFDLSDVKGRAKAETIMFYGWGETSKDWEPLVPVNFDLEQGIIAFQLDRFDRPVDVFVTAMPGGPPPVH